MYQHRMVLKPYSVANSECAVDCVVVAGVVSFSLSLSTILKFLNRHVGATIDMGASEVVVTMDDGE